MQTRTQGKLPNTFNQAQGQYTERQIEPGKQIQIAMQNFSQKTSQRLHMETDEILTR